MEYDILYRPSYSVLRVKTQAGEEIDAEPGALMMMKGEYEVKTRGRGLLRALAGGESFFVNTYVSKRDDSELWLVPPWPGDIEYIGLDGSRGLIVNDKAYLAAHGNIEYKTVWRGLRGMFGGGGLVWLLFKGKGGVWVSSYGAIAKVEARDGYELTIDNTHLVAMDDTLEYDIKRFGKLKSFIFGGEGFVFCVKGTGRIYLQTRNPAIWFLTARSR